MKDEFLKELETKLKEASVSNYEEVVAKYEKRYNFGIESGLSEEEIENMLGNIDEIVMLHKKETRYEYKEKETFSNMAVSVETVSDNVLFESSKDDNIHVYFENIDQESYNIEKTDYSLKVQYIAKKFFGLNRRRPGKIIIGIPDNMSLSKLHLSTVGGDFVSKIDLDSQFINIDMVSGDSEFLKIKSNDIKIHLVSGDIEIEELKTSKITVNSVSGDASIDRLYADELKVDTISGDLVVDEALDNMVVKSSSISGSVKIKDKKYKNFTGKMEEL